MRKILVVAAHPDDEVLGCGGAIAKHTSSGDKVDILFMTDGVSSRGDSDSDVRERKESARQAADILGVSSVSFLDFPDNEMDSVPLLETVKAIEDVIFDIKPCVIYTHYSGDLNIDHQLTHRAVLTACRPHPDSFVKEIYSFEVLSSTHWQSYSEGTSFNPNYFLNIGKFIEKKIKALQCYNEEMREYPHARSYKVVKSMAEFRGGVVGLEYSEAFQVERVVK